MTMTTTNVAYEGITTVINDKGKWVIIGASK